MDFFSKIKVSKPTGFQSLKAGEHVVRLAKYQQTDSSLQFDGKAKDVAHDYLDATPQLAITVVEVNGAGGLTHRLNGCGYVKFDDLSEKDLESGLYVDVEGYACFEDNDGDLVRKQSEEKTAICTDILMQFVTALGIAEGTALIKGLDKAIEDKYEMRITVTNEPYEGKDQLRISKFNTVAVLETKADFED